MNQNDSSNPLITFFLVGEIFDNGGIPALALLPILLISCPILVPVALLKQWMKHQDNKPAIAARTRDRKLLREYSEGKHRWSQAIADAQYRNRCNGQAYFW